MPWFQSSVFMDKTEAIAIKLRPFVTPSKYLCACGTRIMGACLVYTSNGRLSCALICVQVAHDAGFAETLRYGRTGLIPERLELGRVVRRQHFKVVLKPFIT